MVMELLLGDMTTTWCGGRWLKRWKVTLCDLTFLPFSGSPMVRIGKVVLSAAPHVPSHHTPLPNADTALARVTFSMFTVCDDEQLSSTVPSPFPPLFLA